MGPKHIAGKNVNPPIIRITPNSNAAKSGELVENVPIEGGVIFFFANRPAKAKLGQIIAALAINITTPNVRL